MIIMTPIDSVPMFDFNIIKFIQDNFHNPVSDAVFPIMTYLGEAGAIWIAAAIIMICFFMLKHILSFYELNMFLLRVIF